MKNKIFILASIILVVSSIFFVNKTDNDYDKKLGGKHQITGYKINKLDNNESEVIFSTTHAGKGKMDPKVKVLNGDDYIFKGEKKVKDNSLGKYIVEITYIDTRVQKMAKEKIKNDNEYLVKSNNLINKVDIAYPPDDSMMVVYIGCNKKPTIETTETNKELKIKLK